MISSLQDLHRSNAVIFRCVYGSRLFGLDTPQSDTDIRGVFIMPRSQLYGLEHIDYLHDERHNEAYWEVGRFVELLLKSNPNALEVLAAEPPFRLLDHPSFSLLRPSLFLSKHSCQTFTAYAETQLKKARGLNKKLNLPVERAKPSVLRCCFVLEGYGSQPLEEWLASQNLSQERCGLVRVPHMRDLYAIFTGAAGEYRGIVSGDTSGDVLTSPIPIGREPEAFLSFNKDDYRRACREYSEYLTWVSERNDERYEANRGAGGGYDTKNMMHVFRLLGMAEDIVRTGRLINRRPERDFLLSIKQGVHSYEELCNQAAERIVVIRELTADCTLRETPDRAGAIAALVQVREAFYG